MDSKDGNKKLTVETGATVGVKYSDGTAPPDIGSNSVIRSGTVIYNDVKIGKEIQTGHYALIREQTIIGSDCLVGTQAVIDGYTTVGDSASMQTGVYVPSYTDIGDRVFLGPNATLLNDPYPVRADTELAGPSIEDDTSIGANATVLPEVKIGKGAFVAAGAVVTEDVPSKKLAVGAPATIEELPAELEGGNDL